METEGSIQFSKEQLQGIAKQIYCVIPRMSDEYPQGYMDKRSFPTATPDGTRCYFTSLDNIEYIFPVKEITHKPFEKPTFSVLLLHTITRETSGTEIFLLCAKWEGRDQKVSVVPFAVQYELTNERKRKKSSYTAERVGAVFTVLHYYSVEQIQGQIAKTIEDINVRLSKRTK